MGMLVEGVWHDDADRSMQNGTYRREPSPLPSNLDDAIVARLEAEAESFVLVASKSCPWSHATVLAARLKGLLDRLPLQQAGGPRVEGYALLSNGPLFDEGYRHAHQLYSSTVADYTGRATVPILWDSENKAILSNSSADLIKAFDKAGEGPALFPESQTEEIEVFIPWLFENLSNAVYRAGKAERQDEYEDATSAVYAALHNLEARLADRTHLFNGDAPTAADIRLFATLVRYDTVYATHFRVTRYRLTDFPNLWRFTRRIYQMPGIAETVDFDEIRRGYYLNDGAHNPFGLVADQPQIDWDDRAGL